MTAEEARQLIPPEPISNERMDQLKAKWPIFSPVPIYFSEDGRLWPEPETNKP